jgi:hypothetical protein
MKEQTMKLPKAFSSRGAEFGRTPKTGPADLPYTICPINSTCNACGLMPAARFYR